MMDGWMDGWVGGVYINIYIYIGWDCVFSGRRRTRSISRARTRAINTKEQARPLLRESKKQTKARGQLTNQPKERKPPAFTSSLSFFFCLLYTLCVCVFFFGGGKAMLLLSCLPPLPSIPSQPHPIHQTSSSDDDPEP